MTEIKNIDATYKIDEFGNVHNQTKILKPAQVGIGYLAISLHGKTTNVHQLVARMFIPNPNALPCVNHIDGNKLNNHVNNLEWCTQSYNLKHAWKNGLNIGRSKSVIQYDKDTNIVAEYKSAKEAERLTNISNGNINKVCNGIRKSAGGYTWKFGGIINGN